MKLKGLAISSLMVLMCYGQIINAKVIKIATLSPDGTAWMKAMRAGADDIKKQTQGRVIIKFYPGGVMGNDKNVIRKIRIGQLHGGAVTSGSLTSIYPDMDIYGLPYLFSTQKQVDEVRAKLDKYLFKGLEKKGFVGFGLAGAGFSYMMSDGKINTVDDVKKKKIWIPANSDVGFAVFKSAGISPVPLPLSDVLIGLQTGLVDTVFASPIGAIALQWHTKIKYIADLPLTYLSALLVINKKTFYKLKASDRKILRQVMTKVFKSIDKRNQKDNISARKALENNGIEFIQLSKIDLKIWREVGRKAIEELERKNNYSKSLFKRLIKAVNTARQNSFHL